MGGKGAAFSSKGSQAGGPADWVVTIPGETLCHRLGGRNNPTRLEPKDPRDHHSAHPNHMGPASCPLLTSASKNSGSITSLSTQFEMNQLLSQLVLCLTAGFQHLPATEGEENRPKCSAERSTHVLNAVTCQPGKHS